MSEAGTELLEKIMALDPEERRAIAEELYARVNESEEDAEIFQLATQRWEELQKDPTQWIGHDELMRSLRD